MQQARVTEIVTPRCSRCGALLRNAAGKHNCLQPMNSFQFAELFWDEV